MMTPYDDGLGSAGLGDARACGEQRVGGMPASGGDTGGDADGSACGGTGDDGTVDGGVGRDAPAGGTAAPVGRLAHGDRPRLLVIGRTASGKDTLADALRWELGLTFVKSCTTRPKRTPDEDTHVFLTEAQAGPLLGGAVAYTRIGDYSYFTTAKQVMEADGYVIDPIGMRMLCRNMPDARFVIAHVHADAGQRLRHAVRRGDAEVEATAFARREAAEDAEFTAFERDARAYADGDRGALPPNVSLVVDVENRYDDSFPECGVHAVARALGLT